MKKVVLITGCSSGFGFETAKLLSQSGFITYASARNLQSAGIKTLKALGLPNLHFLPLDVTQKQIIHSAINQIIKQQGKIDILINNAGFGYLGPIETFTTQEIQAQYDTNLFGPLRCVKAVIPHMRQCHSGLIINLSSINGLVPFPLFGVYSSSKFALETLSETLKFELKPFGINVVLVEPGSFRTRFTQNRHLAAGLATSAYGQWATDFYSRLGHQEQHLPASSMQPQRVSKAILKICRSSHPKLRYRVGFDAHLYYWAHKFLPYPIWSKIINFVYRWS